MKKLLIVAAALVSAVAVHAASVQWTITNVNGPTGAALGTGHAYVFFVQQDSGKADTSAWSALEGKGAAELIAAVASANFDYTHSDITAADGVWSYNSTTASAIDQGTIGLAGSTKYSVYAVIFDSETISDDSKFMVTSAASATATYGDSAGTTKTFAIGSQATASGTWYSTAAVPEPTSGLLMLLGMAGLALRRRRA